jgi:hypothetical protein
MKSIKVRGTFINLLRDRLFLLNLPSVTEAAFS